MSTFTFNTEATYGIARAHGSCEIEIAKLPEAIIVALLRMALDNKVGDTVSGVKKALGAPYFIDDKAVPDKDLTPDQLATVGKEASRVMNEARDALYSGAWSRRGEASESDPLTTFRRSVIRDNFDAKQAATYKAIGDATRKNDYVDGLYDKQDDEAKAAIDALATDLKAIADKAKADKAATMAAASALKLKIKV